MWPQNSTERAVSGAKPSGKLKWTVCMYVIQLDVQKKSERKSMWYGRRKVIEVGLTNSNSDNCSLERRETASPQLIFCYAVLPNFLTWMYRGPNKEQAGYSSVAALAALKMRSTEVGQFWSSPARSMEHVASFHREEEAKRQILLLYTHYTNSVQSPCPSLRANETGKVSKSSFRSIGNGALFSFPV